MTAKELLTTSDAARELAITAGRVRALISAGRLRTTQIGGMHLIDPVDLEAVRIRRPGRPWPKGGKRAPSDPN